MCGVWLGLLVLTRATFLLSVAGLFTMLVLDRHLTRALTLLVVTLGLVLPWAVRGWVIDGSLLPSRVGENLYVSTNRLSRAVGPRYDIDLIVPYAYEEIADEVAASSAPSSNAEVADRVLRNHAVRFAAAHPLEVAWLKMRNFLYLFDPRLLPGYEKAAATRVVVEGSSVRFESRETSMDRRSRARRGAVISPCPRVGRPVASPTTVARG